MYYNIFWGLLKCTDLKYDVLTDFGGSENYKEPPGQCPGNSLIHHYHKEHLLSIEVACHMTLIKLNLFDMLTSPVSLFNAFVIIGCYRFRRLLIRKDSLTNTDELCFFILNVFRLIENCCTTKFELIIALF